MRKIGTQRRFVFTIVSLGVTCGVFFYLFKYISVGEVVQLIREVDRNALAMFAVLSLSMSFFRTWRYRILLKLYGYQPGSFVLFLVVLVRNLFSDLLPARLGTLSYVFIVNTRLGIPLAPATLSFTFAFLFDILALSPLILLASFAATTKVKLSLLVGAAALGGIALILIYCLPRIFSFLARLRFIKERWRQGLVSIGEEIVRVKQAKLYAPLLALSLLVRITKYASLYVFLYALLHTIGYDWSDLHIPSVFLGICASELAASLPISGIAAFGAYEGVWAIVFGLLGFPGHIAKLTAVSHHLFTQVYGYLLGAFAFILLILPLFRKEKFFKLREYAVKSRFSFYPKFAASSLALVLLLFGLFMVPLKKIEKRYITADQITQTEKRTRVQLSKHFPGKILFDSNRSGTFGIYTINVDGTELQCVIDDSRWHEMYPDPSPDGNYIVYSRAKTISRFAPSEIWIVEQDGTKPKMVVANGNYPTFSTGGKTIYFERQRKKVMAIDLDGGNERELFPAKNKDFRRYRVVKPRLSSDGRFVAFTSDRQGQWNVWYAEIETGKALHIHRGREPVFFSGNRQIAWIKPDAREGTGIYAYNIFDCSSTVLEDAGRPKGHEYFPTLAAGGRFLLYSACQAKEHSHKFANYQIYAKDLKTGVKARISFDAYTNRWPKFIAMKVRI